MRARCVVAVEYPEGMPPNLDQILLRLREFVDEVRPTCLWYLAEDYYPQTTAEALRVVDAIERHGDLQAFRRAAQFRAWLSPRSSAPSVDS